MEEKKYDFCIKCSEILFKQIQKNGMIKMFSLCEDCFVVMKESGILDGKREIVRFEFK